MTPYNYHQYYLACINDGGLHGMVQAAYRGYRGELNRHSSCFNNLCAKIDRHCVHMKRRFGLDPICALDLSHRARREAEEELYHAVIFRLLNGEDHPSVKSEDYYGRTYRPETAREQAEREALDERAMRKNQNFIRNYAVQGMAADLAGVSFDMSKVDFAEVEARILAVGPAIPDNIPKPNQGAPMSTSIQIEQRTYLNGVEAKNYSDAQLITMIEQAEAETERLRKVKTKSDKITARIGELKDGATQLAELLDSRTK